MVHNVHPNAAESATSTERAVTVSGSEANNDVVPYHEDINYEEQQTENNSTCVDVHSRVRSTENISTDSLPM